MRFPRKVAFQIALLTLTASSALAQTWAKVGTTGTPPPAAWSPLLLTDGTVMVQNPNTRNWYKLTPNNVGSYLAGTWTQIASLPVGHAPLYYASSVLADGRVILFGGEYNGSGNPVWINKGAIYDPIANTWTALTPPSGWNQIGDAQCTVLPDKTWALASPLDTKMAIMDPTTLTWIWTTNAAGKTDRFDEEGWTLLPEGTILTVDAINAPATEKFIISTRVWQSAGSTPQSLTDAGSQEIGPAVLRPDGTVLATGGTGHNAIYTPGPLPTSLGSWAAAPDLPVSGGQMKIADGPAVLLPSGNVLVAASPGIFVTPTRFYEFNGTSWVSRPNTPRANSDSCFQVNFLMLPNGQVLQVDQSNDVEIFTPSGSPNNAWRPTISSCPSSLAPGQSFVISGTQFNGLSECSMYGDDASMSTNYPIVRITNIATGHVFYCRTHDHSVMGVATGGTTVSTNVDIPGSIELGASNLEVVANGIASAAFAVTISSSSVATVLTEANASGAIGQTVSQAATLRKASDSTPISGKTISFTVNGSAAGSGSTNASGVATANYVITEAIGVGSIPMSAGFSGDGTYGASTAGATLTVSKANTAIDSVTSPSGTYGQTVTLTGKLTRTTDNASLSGKTLDFTVSGTAVGSATTSATGVANLIYFIPESKAAGAHTITVSFAGTSLYNSTSTNGTLTINKGATTTTPANNSGTFGQTINLTATLKRTSDSGNLSGKTVTFKIDGSSVGSAVTNGSGLATLSYSITTSLATGTHSLSAEFAGDALYNSSTGNATLTVSKGNTALTATDATGFQGGTAPLVANLSRTFDGAALAGKTVNFKIDGSAVGFAATNAAGVATLTYNIPPATTTGAHSITADFAGDSQYNSSTASGILTVNPAPGATVTGHVDLEFLPAPLGESATIEFRTPTTLSVVFSALITLDASGNYSVGGVPPGTYDVAVKFSNWLRQVLPSVIISSPSTTGVNFALFNGDAFQDNVVDVFDLNLMFSNFGNAGADPADINRSSLVDVFDLNIAFGDFGKVGDN